MEKQQISIEPLADCKEWLSIPETFEALKAVGIPNFSLWRLRDIANKKALPFLTKRIGSRWYVYTPSLRDFVTRVFGALPIPEANGSKYENQFYTVVEILKIFEAEQIPSYSKAKALRANPPFEFRRFGHILYALKSDVHEYIENLKKPE